MKLRVAFTRRSNFDIDDLDFLTEALLLEATNDEIRKAREYVQQVYTRLIDAENKLREARTTEEKNAARTEYNKASYDYERAVAVLHSVTAARDPNAGALINRDPNAGALIVRDPNAGDIVVQKSETAVVKFKAMMETTGNSLSGFFNILMGWLKGLPDLAKKILGKLKPLWEKIKAWGTKFHIFYRAKALSRATICCVGFIASMVASWIYSIIFGKNSKQANDRRSAASRLRGRMSKHMHLFAHPGMTKKTPNTTKPSDTTVNGTETAVFIEAFGEILREDFNGESLIAMAQTTIKRCKGTVTALKKACSNAAAPLKDLANNLYVTVVGSDATLTGKGNELKAGTIYDNSLPALYESIIREAQAHKIKSIKKKAIKKVAMKKARAKKALKGRM